jgi:putative transposase
MSKLAARKKRVKRTVSIGRVLPEAVEQVADLNGRIEAIQWLIPLGLEAVSEELQRAVVELAGPRYERKESDHPLRRWGSQPGSVYLGDQKLPVEVPRVRNVDGGSEVPLRAYQALQTPRQMDEGLLLRMLKGIATRNYEACAEAVPEAFGLSSSSVSRRYVKGTARKLAQFQERSLEDYDLVALFLDGKSFADEEIIIALGVTLDGQKIPLGL